jgi:hypothetical protein
LSARAESCIHDLDPAWCAVCNGTDRRAAGDGGYGDGDGLDARGPWFAARYPGHCGGCLEHVEPGGMIRADGDGGYLCLDCGEGS